jgi:hypothetical protein
MAMMGRWARELRAVRRAAGTVREAAGAGLHLSRPVAAAAASMQRRGDRPSGCRGQAAGGATVRSLACGLDELPQTSMTADSLQGCRCCRPRRGRMFECICLAQACT